MPELNHKEGCPRQRTETFTNGPAEVTRCIDCGAQAVTHHDEPTTEEPVSFQSAKSAGTTGEPRHEQGG
jgi:hypothetical protein